MSCSLFTKNDGSFTKRGGTLSIILLAYALLALCGCKDPAGVENGRDFRQEMRDLVKNLSAHARRTDPDFAVIIQNGHEILTDSGGGEGTPAASFIDAIDGAARESLFYGYDEDDKPTPPQAREQMLSLTEVARRHDLAVLVTDYCSIRSFVDDSYARNQARGYASFAADHRDLDNIPAYPEVPANINGDDITSLQAARNFLYLIDSGEFAHRNLFLDSLGATDYDLLILDLSFDYQPLSPAEVAALKRKAGGGKRMVVAYMSIGEAEDYRYYFDPEWIVDPPSWLAAENPDWEGNYKVRYWEEDWQAIIYGDADSYLQKILDGGFDGVYLDIIDAFEYFER